MEDIGAKLSAFVEMRKRIKEGPAQLWDTLSEPAIERELARLVMPSVHEGTYWNGDESFYTADGTPLDTFKAPNLAALRKLATPAPFGRGTKRVEDTTVRDAREIPADKLRFTEDFADKLLSACKLRMDGLKLRAEVYKLHLYEKGGHFTEHKDTPHGDDHFMSGILILGSPFDGGELVVSGHTTPITQYIPERESYANVLRVAAWYTDVPHAVKPVTSGTRVVIQFDIRVDASDPEEEEEKYDADRSEAIYSQMEIANSALTPPPSPAADDAAPTHESHLPAVLAEYWKTHTHGVAFLLRHQYVTRQLDEAHLKGTDRALYRTLKGAEDVQLALEYLILARTIPGGDTDRGEPDFEPVWGPLRAYKPTGDTTTNWSVDPRVKLVIGPYVMYERATELDHQASAEHTGNEPMNGNEVYLFAALVARSVGEPPKKRARKVGKE